MQPAKTLEAYVSQQQVVFFHRFNFRCWPKIELLKVSNQGFLSVPIHLISLPIVVSFGDHCATLTMERT